DLDPFNQMLAVTETRIHLELLAAQGRLVASTDGGVTVYTPAVRVTGSLGGRAGAPPAPAPRRPPAAPACGRAPGPAAPWAPGRCPGPGRGSPRRDHRPSRRARRPGRPARRAAARAPPPRPPSVRSGTAPAPGAARQCRQVALSPADRGPGPGSAPAWTAVR